MSSGRPMICGGGCGCGPGRGITYSAASWGAGSGTLRSVGRAAQTARYGGRALTVVCQHVGLGVSCKVVLAEAVSCGLVRCGTFRWHAAGGAAASRVLRPALLHREGSDPWH